MRIIPHSIKWRIQFWHGLLLTIITSGLLWGFFRYEKQMQLDRLDSKLLMYFYRVLPALVMRERSGGETPEYMTIDRKGGARLGHPFPGVAPNLRAGGAPLPPPLDKEGRRRERLHRSPEFRAERFLEQIEKNGLYCAVWRLDGTIIYKSGNAPSSHVFPKVKIISLDKDKEPFHGSPEVQFNSNIHPRGPINGFNDQGIDQATEPLQLDNKQEKGSRFTLPHRPPRYRVQSLEPPELQPRVLDAAGETFFYVNRANFREIIQKTGPNSFMIVGISMDGYSNEIRSMGWNLFAIGGVVVLLGLLGGAYLANDAVRPIRLITEAAESISQGQRHRRVEESESDTDLGRLSLVLNKAFDQLGSMVQKQIRFVADASHELRTPVTIVMCQTQAALQKRRDEQDYRRALRACQRAGQRMNGLIASLLELARADSRKMDLFLERIDLAEFLKQAAQFVQPLAEKCNIKIELRLEPVEVELDAERMNQVITNLLTNAIQHNPPDEAVVLECRVDEEEVLIHVRDCGEGIEKSEIPFLFERFHRGDSSRSHKSGGYGLGLSICKAIVESHNGRILVESELQCGSTFSVHLPLIREVKTESIPPQ